MCSSRLRSSLVRRTADRIRKEFGRLRSRPRRSVEKLVAEAYRKHGYLLGFFDDVVEAIMYLDQATFVTGETLHVDGGQSAGF